MPARESRAPGPPSVRVVGPLLLDSNDQPVWLRGIRIPGFADTPSRPAGPVPPAMAGEDLERLSDWGINLVCVPVALDLALDTAPVADPRLVLPAGTAAALDEPPREPVLRDGYLRALDAAVANAGEYGLYILVELASLGDGTENVIPFESLRAFWRLAGARYADTPNALFTLLRAPRALPVDGQDLSSHDPIAVQQWQTMQRAMLGELRAAHPGSVVVAEALAGTVCGLPLTYTDGTVAPGVIAGYRATGGSGAPPETAAIARRVPVIASNWRPTPAVTTRLGVAHLAAGRSHWIADGWPPTGTVRPGRIAITTPGWAVQTRIAQPNEPLGQSRSTGQPAPIRPLLPRAAAPSPDQGIDPTLGRLPGLPGRMIVDLVEAAVPDVPPAPPPALPPIIAPRAAASEYLPTVAVLRETMTRANRAERESRISLLRDHVRHRWDTCDAGGILGLLSRVRDAETATRADGPQVPDLPGAVPHLLRSRLDIHAAAGPAIGTALVTGTITAHGAAATAGLTTQALMGLRALDDVLARIVAADRCADATGRTVAEVLALYRTEGNLGMPPSAASIGDGLPSGTAREPTSVTPRPDLTTLVWLADAKALRDSGVDAADLATREMIIQIAGLDVLGGSPAGGDDYRQWSYDTWRLAGRDDAVAAARRAALLAAAVTVTRPAGRHRRDPAAIAAIVDDPVGFVTTVVGDGVQLLHTLRDAGPLLAPAAADGAGLLDPGIAYLRYNIGDVKTRRALISAAHAAGTGSASRWRDLRGRLRGEPFLVAGLAAGLEASRRARGRADGDAALDTSWPRLAAWLTTPDNLRSLTAFVETASAAEWASWQEPRANVARYRILLDYYGRLYDP